MTPGQIATLRAQTGLSQSGFAARLNEIDPHMRVALTSVSRWENGHRTPDAHSLAALASLWLDAGYPCTANGRPATLTTNSPASSYGLPVVVIDGVPHGSADVAALDLGDCPETIRDAAIRAGYVVS